MMQVSMAAVSISTLMTETVSPTSRLSLRVSPQYCHASLCQRTRLRVVWIHIQPGVPWHSFPGRPCWPPCKRRNTMSLQSEDVRAFTTMNSMSILFYFCLSYING
jgi:hypothetical protein